MPPKPASPTERPRDDRRTEGAGRRAPAGWACRRRSADWKAANRDWSHCETSLALVARTAIDQVSIETASVGVDIGVIELLRGKDVLLGLVDVCGERVEMATEIADGLRRALDHIAPDRLFACTDCGLVLRSRAAASGKMRALAEGARLAKDLIARSSKVYVWQAAMRSFAALRTTEVWTSAQGMAFQPKKTPL